MAYELTLEDILEAEGMQQQQPKQPDEYQLTMEDILEAEAMQPQPEQPMNLMEKIKSLRGQGLTPFKFDSQQADMDMSQLAGEQLRDISAVGKGAQAGFKKSLAGIKGEYYEPEIVPEGEGFAYGLGEMLGQAPLYGAIAAPIAASGGALGAPIIGGLLGGAVAGAATTPGDVPGRALGAAMGAIPAAIPGLKLPNVIKTLMTKSEPRKLGLQIQSSHDAKKAAAQKLYNTVSEEAGKRGISKVQMDKDLINQAMDYLPETKASRDLINKASTGDYDSVRTLQSDLRKRAEKRLKSDLGAENYQGEMMLECGS
jgi:outer membrane lipoprotein SlyB